jgi:DNA topoisomerase-3
LRGYEPTADFVEQILAKKSYANIAKTQYTDDSKVTDHYAIIPTGQLTELGKLNSLQRAVFDLIVRRFLSIFYPPAEYQTVRLVVSVEADGSKEQFFASAKVLKNPGYLAVAGIPGKKSKNDPNEVGEEQAADPQELLALAQTLKKGDAIPVHGYAVKEGKTSPPKRYTSGSMVLAMENAGQLIEDEELREQIKGSGIGTSATRAEIIKKLVRIHYLNLNKKTQVLTPENLGEMVYEVVNMTVPALLNPKMTASWEKGLDGITRGTVDFWEYRRKLEGFIRTETQKMIDQNIRSPLAERISDFAGENAKGIGARRKIGAVCPACGGEMVTTPFGYGCTNYKNDKSGCNFNIGEIAGVSLSEEQVKALLADGHTQTIRGFKTKAGKKFDACLKLVKDEEGRTNIAFDFADVEPEIMPDVKCPECGGQMQKTSFGYGCTNFNPGDEKSCRFSIGTIAGKKIPVTAVRQLLTEGKTGTLRGFKSKAGKRFDACLKLKKDEDGRTRVQFDFDHVEPKKVKDVQCPKCGGAVVVAPFGFVCENNRRDDPESCRFMVGKVASVKITETQLRQLLQQKKTDVITGFVAKTGIKFDAPLKLTETGDIVFDFPERPKPVNTKVPCPRCGRPLQRSQWRYECECGFQVWHTVAKVPLSEEIMGELLTTGKTKNKVAGFTSKAGNVFDACLKYENEQILFDFENPGEGTAALKPEVLFDQNEAEQLLQQADDKAEPGNNQSI